MPTYKPLDTTISVLFWEPLKGKTPTGEHKKANQAVLPWVGQHVERLKEDHLTSPELNFLGPSNFPFYLINAGQDLFYKPRPKNVKRRGRQLKQEDGAVKNRSRTTTPKAVPRIPKFLNNDNVATPATSSLTVFESSDTNLAMRLDGTTDGPRVTTRQNSSEPKGWKARLPVVPSPLHDTTSRPILSPLPIKIQVDISQKTFMRSLVDGLPSDICVNVFYNGELTHSRVSRAGTVRSTNADGKQLPSSGRRVNTSLEAPFVMAPIPQSGMSSNTNILSLEERWHRNNELLLAEADEWGRQGKFGTHRTPVGEYLEELSRTELPEILKGRGNGKHAGIIDVVIALGRSLVINFDSAHVDKPQRKLAEAVCGKGEKVRRYSIPEQSFQGKAFSGLTEPSAQEQNRGPRTSPIKNGPRATNDKVLKIKKDFNASTKKDAEQAIRNTTHIAGENPGTSVVLPQLSNSIKPYDRHLKHGEQRYRQPASTAPSSLVLTHKQDKVESPSTAEIQSQNSKPKKVPQKRWKGAASENPECPTLDQMWEVEPFDISIPAALSTRSHRTATPTSSSAPSQSHILGTKNLRLRIPRPRLEHNQFSTFDESEDINIDDQDVGILPPSPSPMNRNVRVGRRQPRIDGTANLGTLSGQKKKASGKLHGNLSDPGSTSKGHTSKPTNLRGVGNNSSTRPRTTRDGSKTQAMQTNDSEAGASLNRVVVPKRKRASTNASTASSDIKPPAKVSRLKTEAGIQVTTDSLLGQTNVPMSLVQTSKPPARIVADEESSNLRSTALTSERKGSHKAPISERELSMLLGPHNPLTPVSGSLTDSPTARSLGVSGVRMREKNTNNAVLGAAMKDNKHGISATQKNKHTVIFRGMKLRNLLQKELDLKRPVQDLFSKDIMTSGADLGQAQPAEVSTNAEKDIGKKDVRPIGTIETSSFFHKESMVPRDDTASSARADFDVSMPAPRNPRVSTYSKDTILPEDKGHEAVALYSESDKPPSTMSEGLSNILHNDKAAKSPTRSVRISKQLINSWSPIPSTPVVEIPKSAETLELLSRTNPQQSAGMANMANTFDKEWEPPVLCKDSVLTYADLKNTNGWAGMKIDEQTQRGYRGARLEKEGVFRSTSILMGVRFLIGVRSD